jgi:hypothetical protein
MRKLKVFICSPYAPNDYITSTKQYVLDCCYAACMLNVAPFAPHALYTQFLDDNDENHRKIGLENGFQYLQTSDELWICSTYFSPGMLQEIGIAIQLNIPIKHFVLDYWNDKPILYPKGSTREAYIRERI